MKLKFLLGVLAYVVPTFPLGYIWHLVAFADYYRALEIYRSDIIIPFGLGSMLIQGVVWAYLYSRLFAHERVVPGALKFAALAVPLAWTYLVLVIAAKHHMASVADFVKIETAFTAVQFLIVSPLLALALAERRN